MQTPSSTTVTLLVLFPLIGWRVYSRFRRMVGRQRLSRIRPWITLAIFPTLLLLLGLASHAHLERLGLLCAGVVVGSFLGLFGLGKTLFEPTKTGLFYTPNTHLGIALSLLFVGRIIYRFVEVYAIDPKTPNTLNNFAVSPITLAIFGLLAGYYITYAIGLARWRFRVLKAKRLREAENCNT